MERSVIARSVVVAAAMSFAAGFVVLAVIGGYRSYTPVPFWDMWSGYLDFYMRFSEGEFAALHEFHNEHRLVLAKLFFYVDLRFFEGRGIFLTVFNYLFALSGFILFSKILLSISAGQPRRDVLVVVNLVLFCLFFSWIQNANFTWAFQSQFFMAQLMPLLAFYLLHRSGDGAGNSSRYFIAGCAVGVLSLGTMANGILCLPLMVVQAVVMRLSVRRIVALGVLAMIGAGLYLNGYETPSHHTGVLQALSSNPLGFIGFILLYLGGPAYYAGNFHAVTFGMFAGSLLLLAIAMAGFDTLRRTELRSIKTVLCIWLLFFMGGAVATAGGRVGEGVEYAVSSRYMTPVLMAWAAILVFLLHVHWRRGGNLRWHGASLLLVPLLLLPPQLDALENLDKVRFERMMAALALELGAGDYNQILTVYPRLDEVLEISKRARARDLSVFGLSPVRDASERLGNVRDTAGFPECIGHLDAAVRLARDPDFIQLIGWMFDPQLERAPVAIEILDSAGRVVGFGLSGNTRTDLLPLISPHSGKSGIKAYVLSRYHDQALVAMDVEGRCRLDLGVPDERMVVLE